MVRKKAYDEATVIEKALELFWCNGYETTSMRLLEETMGINKFSIYSSFESKQGVFLECIKSYKRNLQKLVVELKDSTDGVAAIKAYFHAILEFSKGNKTGKGCLLASTAGELGANGDKTIMKEVSSFSDQLKTVFAEKLATDKTKSQDLIVKQANYLLLAIQGLANASKVYERHLLEDYIEMTFKNI